VGGAQQGDRFGGALDGAAEQFSGGYDKGLSPADFVEDMRRSNRLILGIGHRIKSRTNPDLRVTIIKEFVRKHFPAAPILDYALAVEAVRPQRGVGGRGASFISRGVCLGDHGQERQPHSECGRRHWRGLCRLDAHVRRFQPRRGRCAYIRSRGSHCATALTHACGGWGLKEYVKTGTLNALFVVGRSIGFVGHYLDQKRLKQGLYRHPWDDISYLVGNESAAP
jgi:ATP citrate (pro-S)-lyase